MSLKEKLQKIWSTLRPQQKKMVVFLAIVIGIAVLAVPLYKATRTKHPEDEKKQQVKTREIGLDKGVLEKSLFNESAKANSELQEQVKSLQQQFEDVKTGKITLPTPAVPEKPDLARQIQNGKQTGLSIDKKEIEEQAKEAIDKQKQGKKGQASMPPVPPPPPVPGSQGLPAGQTQVPLPPGVPGVPPAPGSGVSSQSKPEIYGDIGFVSQRIDKVEESKKKESKTTIYLPPSFMEATLLSGVYALTSSNAKGEPLPVLIRVKNMAILPNSVRGDLKGCFYMGEATGNLSDERAHIRINTLSCLTRGGQAVIDQKVKGYVVDSDGFVGLRGNVVSKMGAAVARSMFASFISGFGDALNTSSFTTVTGGSGISTTLDTDKAVQAGVGKGISQGGHDLQKFLLDLGKQAVPAIEVGARSNITVVISEGVELEVKERPNTCMGGKDKCAKN